MNGANPNQQNFMQGQMGQPNMQGQMGQPNGQQQFNQQAQPGMQPGMQAGMQPGMQTGMQPGMQTGMQQGMQPGMQSGMQPGMMQMQNFEQMQGQMAGMDMEEQQKMLNQYKNFQADSMQNEAIRQMAPMEGNFQMNRGGQGFNPNGFNRNMQMNMGGMGMGGMDENDFGNNNKYKTALCNNFESAGFCKFGDNCKFAHGEQDLRSNGNQGGGFNQRGGGDFQNRGRGGFGGQRGGGFVQRGGNFGGQRGGFNQRGGGDQMNPGFGGQNMGQMQVCRYFQQNGVCKFGDTCKFIHIGDSD